jgi:hypothetical protein
MGHGREVFKNRRAKARLNLEQTFVTDVGVRALRAHPNLKCLFVAGNSLTNSSLEVFGDMPQLQRVTVSGKGFTKDAARAFRSKHPGISL